MTETPNETDKFEAFAAHTPEPAGYSQTEDNTPLTAYYDHEGNLVGHMREYPNREPVVTGYTVTLQQPKVKAGVIFVLAFFLGNLGIHRFYMRQYGMGVLYLFTLGLFFIGSIVDCIICRRLARRENTRRGYGPVTK